MANLFDAGNSPTQEPLEVVVGDYIQWRRVDLSTDYPNDEYTATYVARITGGGANEIQVTGTAYNSDYLFTVDSTTSADFVARGVVIQPDRTTGDPGDQGTHQRRRPRHGVPDAVADGAIR